MSQNVSKKNEKKLSSYLAQVKKDDINIKPNSKKASNGSPRS